MKEWEAYQSGGDAIEEGIEYFRQYLRDRPEELKETVDYNRITDFLNLHLHNSEDPVIGNMYVPVSVTSRSFAASILVKILNAPGKLMHIDELHRAYKFLYNNKTESFPEGERKAGDITQFGLLYNNKNEADEFLSMLHISFGQWDIKIQKI